MQVAVKEKSPDEPAGLERVFIEHQGRVFRAAYRITGNAQDAEDVLQSVFLKLTHQGEPLAPVDNLSSYLYRTAVNASLDLLRTRRASVPIEEMENAPDRHTPGPDRAQEAGEIRASLRRALAALPEQAALVFSLRYLEGYGNHEIARMAGLSRVRVAVSLHRTRHRLQQEFRELRSGR
jgi:RNA polymerase sigma-70 factor (ECF subfamily)